MDIELTRGLTTVIDDADFDLVRGRRWTAHTSKDRIYAATSYTEDGKRKLLLLHRALLAATPGQLVDHKDGDPLNNRRDNLRLCSHTGNCCNSKLRKSSKSGVRNVQLVLGPNGGVRFRARVSYEKRVYRKYFDSIDNASAWATDLRLSLHGAFAYSAGADSRQA